MTELHNVSGQAVNIRAMLLLFKLVSDAEVSPSMLPNYWITVKKYHFVDK